MSTKIAEVEGAHPSYLGLDEPIAFDAPESPWRVLAENNPRFAILQANFGAGKVLTMRVGASSPPVTANERATFPTDGGQAEWIARRESVKFTVTYDRVPVSNVLEVQFTAAGLALFENGEGGIDIISGTKKLGSLPAPWVEYLPDGEEDRKVEYLSWGLGNKSFSMEMPALTESEWATAVIDPTVITTSTASTATAYSNQRKIDRTSNGVLWAHHWASGSGSAGTTDLQFWYSTDDGATWAQDTGAAFGSAGGFIPNASFFIDVDDYAHVAYKDESNGYIYYRRGTPNAGRTAWTWSAVTTISTDVNSNNPDIIAHREGTGWRAHVVFHLNYVSVDGSTAVTHAPVTISSGGSRSLGATTNLGGTGGGSTAPNYPSIDFNHTGDGKTVAGGTPHLYVAWSAGATGAGKGIRFKKATYSGGSWTWGTEREIDNTRYIDNGDYRWINCLFDGARVVIPGCTYSGSAVDVVLYERDVADSTTTTRVLLAAPTLAERLVSGSATYDAAGNLYLLGTNQDEALGSRDLVYRKWTRSSANLGDETVIDTSIHDKPHASAKRGYSNNRIEFIYTDGTASPYSVTYDSILLNTLPDAPTVTVGGDVIVGDALSVSWVHNDPDTDPQAKAQVRYRKAII